MSGKKCLRCLMRDMREDEYFVDLRSYIANIPDAEKVDDDLYELRLERCKSCRSLISGMCIKCGCYVELRAAIKKGYCPDVNKRW